MKIKEVEYKELITHDYKNCSVGLKAEIGEEEDWEEVLLDLKGKVRDKLTKWIEETNWYSACIERIKEEYNEKYDEYNKLCRKTEKLKKKEEKLKERIKELRLIIREVTKK